MARKHPHPDQAKFDFIESLPPVTPKSKSSKSNEAVQNFPEHAAAAQPVPNYKWHRRSYLAFAAWFSIVLLFLYQRSSPKIILKFSWFLVDMPIDEKRLELALFAALITLVSIYLVGSSLTALFWTEGKDSFSVSSAHPTRITSRFIMAWPIIVVSIVCGLCVTSTVLVLSIHGNELTELVLQIAKEIYRGARILAWDLITSVTR